MTLAVAGFVGLAVGVPTYGLVHWLRVGTSTEFPLGELAAATLSTSDWPPPAPPSRLCSRCRSHGW